MQSFRSAPENASALTVQFIAGLFYQAFESLLMIKPPQTFFVEESRLVESNKSGKPKERKLCQRCKPEGYCITVASADDQTCEREGAAGSPLEILQNGQNIARDLNYWLSLI